MHVRDIIQNQERLCTSGQFEHNKRNFISTSNHLFFVYHINTKALYWQEKSTLLMNENKRIDNPWIRVVKCVDALKMKTCLEWLQKQTVGLISNIKKFTVIELVLADRRNPSGTRTVANLPTFDFRLHQNRRQIMVPWPKIDALRTFIFCEVSIVGKTPLGRKLQPPHLCGLKTIKSWIFHFSK